MASSTTEAQTAQDAPRRAETIETFVAKLQREGVEAGRKEAERIRAQAERQAKDTIRQAEEQAAKCLAEAHRQAQEILAKARSELDLAARDAVLRLQSALSKGLSVLLAGQVGRKLEDPEFLGQLLHGIVMQYVQSDFQCREVLKINVQPEMREKLISWALQEIGKETVEKVRPSIDLKGTLADAGFEYTCDGSTVEVTRESVVETLMDLVGPSLREVLGKAMAGGTET